MWRIQNDNDEILAFRILHRLAPFALGRRPPSGGPAGVCAGLLLMDALLVCLVLHWLTGGIGICMTYHRLLTHRSFATRPRWLEYVLTAIGCCASEGGPIGWVADHRNHHAHSDDEHDLHSPNRGFA